jgi:hypothetical protein
MCQLLTLRHQLGLLALCNGTQAHHCCIWAAAAAATTTTVLAPFAAISTFHYITLIGSGRRADRGIWQEG